MLTYPVINVETWTLCLTISLLGANLISSPLRTRNISFPHLPPLKSEQVINKGNELGSKHLVLLTNQEISLGMNSAAEISRLKARNTLIVIINYNN